MKSGARTPVMFGLWQWVGFLAALAIVEVRLRYLRWKERRS